MDKEQQKATGIIKAIDAHTIEDLLNRLEVTRKILLDVANWQGDSRFQAIQYLEKYYPNHQEVINIEKNNFV